MHVVTSSGNINGKFVEVEIVNVAIEKTVQSFIYISILLYYRIKIKRWRREIDTFKVVWRGEWSWNVVKKGKLSARRDRSIKAYQEIKRLFSAFIKWLRSWAYFKYGYHVFLKIKSLHFHAVKQISWPRLERSERKAQGLATAEMNFCILERAN